MRRLRTASLLCIALAVGLTGCGLTRTSHEASYYSLWLSMPRPTAGQRLLRRQQALATLESVDRTPPGAAPRPFPQATEHPMGPVMPTQTPIARPILVLTRLVVRDPYAQERMVYRASPYQIYFYNYQRWASAPAEQLSDWTMRYLRATGVFDKVLTSQQSANPTDLVLGGVVRRLEEVDQGNVWQAALAVDFWLARGGQDTPIWTRSYETVHPATRRNPEAVAAAMSRDLEQILADLTRDLASVVETLP